LSLYRARRLPVHRGPAAWSAILPAQDAPDILAADTTADFAIVGGGFAGLSAARRLMQLNPGAGIVVLEAGRLAEGAAGRNSGFMVDLPHELSSSDYAGKGADEDREIIGLNRAAIAFARQLVEDYAIAPAFFDPIGKVNGAASEAADRLNSSYAAHLDGLGEASERLDAQAMFEMTGSRHYVSGLYTPGTVLIQPGGYIRGFGKGLRRDGVAVYENSPVLQLRRSGAGWNITTPGGQVAAGKVILANNGHLESFGFARHRLMHIFLYASMTAALDDAAVERLGGVPRWGITPSDPMGTSLRRIDRAQGGSRILVRTCASLRPEMEANQAGLARAAQVHQQKFADRFPMLSKVRMEYRWAGHLCLSRNSVSIVRELDSNLYAACCQNGLGTVRGTMTGIGAAELASGTGSAITEYFSREPEPVRLPPPPFDRIGANSYLRWREWRASKE